MRQNRTEKRIRKEAERRVPDLKAPIKESSTYRAFMKEAQANKRTPLLQKRFVPAFSLVAAVLVIGLFLALPLALNEHGDTTHIQMEFNPSFGIEIDSEDTIVSLHAYNSDAETLFDNTGDLQDKSFDEGLDRLIDEAIALDYLSETNAQILYSVSGDDEERVEAKAAELEEKIPEVARAKGIDHAMAMRSVNGPPGEEEIEEARNHGVGFMKMRLVKNILEATDEYDFETLIEKNIGTLKDIIEEEGIEEHGPPFDDDDMPGPPNHDNRPGPGRP